MARTHAQQFANQTLARAVFAEPLAFLRAIATDDVQSTLAPYWEQAEADLPPISRVAGTGFRALVERQGRYTIAVITPPPPRDSGDPVAIAIIGRGDGVSRISTLAYFVLELVRDPTTSAPRFHVVSFSGHDERGVRCGDGPLPDPRWFAQHAFELYSGRQPDVRRAGVPELPGWYWWLAFDGATALRSFIEARDEAERFEAVRKSPVLLMPAIVDAAEIYSGEAPAKRLRELRPYFRRDASSLAVAWQSLVERLSNTTVGNPVVNIMHAFPLISEATQHGSLTAAQGYHLEATTRSKLAALGVDTQSNYALSEQLFAAARAAERSPRMARGSGAPPIDSDDPVWEPIFLDETDLPECARAEHEEAFSSADASFVAHGGLRAGYAAWSGPEYSSVARLIDQRWVFRTPSAALYFMRAMHHALADGLTQLPTPQIGDDTLAFGNDGLAGGRRTQVIVVRIGRVLARLQAFEGTHAAQSRQILHAAVLQPLAGKVVQRTRKGLASYWLAVAYPTNAVPALLHSPGYDAARLLAKYPMLALSELPSAMTHLGDQYAPVARGLASFQAQIRAHRWATYREAMLALTRQLLETDIGDPRVNAAHAHEIVSELRYMDSDPIWVQLDAACRARG